jgi:hypothetical protein
MMVAPSPRVKLLPEPILLKSADDVDLVVFIIPEMVAMLLLPER